MSGEKNWLKAKDVCHANPPRYDEISVANLYEYAMSLPRMSQYFPDSYPKGRACNREYFFSILATVHPAYFEKLIRDCKNSRFTVNDEESEAKSIALTNDWATALG